LSAEEEKQPEERNAEGGESGTLHGKLDLEQKQADNQTEQTTGQKHSPYHRAKEYLHGHRLRQFITDPRTWFEMAALFVVVVYTSETRRTNNLTAAQLALNRQQAVGSQAAIVTCGLSLYPNNMLAVMFDQRGIAAAKNVCLAFHAVSKKGS
jgi:hypothetical protein